MAHWVNHEYILRHPLQLCSDFPADTQQGMSGVYSSEIGGFGHLRTDVGLFWLFSAKLCGNNVE
jgi:hypothetical protein